MLIFVSSCFKYFPVKKIVTLKTGLIEKNSTQKDDNKNRETACLKFLFYIWVQMMLGIFNYDSIYHSVYFSEGVFHSFIFIYDLQSNSCEEIALSLQKLQKRRSIFKVSIFDIVKEKENVPTKRAFVKFFGNVTITHLKKQAHSSVCMVPQIHITCIW